MLKVAFFSGQLVLWGETDTIDLINDKKNLTVLILCSDIPRFQFHSDGMYLLFETGGPCSRLL